MRTHSLQSRILRIGSKTIGQRIEYLGNRWIHHIWDTEDKVIAQTYDGFIDSYDKRTFALVQRFDIKHSTEMNDISDKPLCMVSLVSPVKVLTGSSYHNRNIRQIFSFEQDTIKIIQHDHFDVAKSPRLAMSQNGKFSVSASSYRETSIILWSMENGSQLREYYIEDKLRNLYFSPNSEEFVVTTQKHQCFVYSVYKDNPIGSYSNHKDDIRNLAFADDGKLIISSNEGYKNGSETHVWNPVDGMQTYKVTGDLVANYKDMILISRDERVILINFKTGQEYLDISGSSDWRQKSKYILTSNLLAIARDETHNTDINSYILNVYYIPHGTLLWDYKVPFQYITDIKFSIDRKNLIVVGGDGEIGWDGDGPSGFYPNSGYCLSVNVGL